jgi:hypothetical protein
MFKNISIASLALVGALNASSSYAVSFDSASLQSVVDGITVGGSSSVDVENDMVTNDGLWSISASGGSFATFVVELAGLAATNEIGIYDASDVNKRVTLFSGADGAGDSKLMSIHADGSVFKNFVDTGINFAGNNFGFYLFNGTHTFFSQTAANGDGIDHMHAYQGNNGDVIALPGYAPGVWTANEYLFAWEDLHGEAWGDYDDAVFMMESVRPSIPEPPFMTIALLGVGVVVASLVDRRVKRNAAHIEA